MPLPRAGKSRYTHLAMVVGGALVLTGTIRSFTGDVRREAETAVAPPLGGQPPLGMPPYAGPGARRFGLQSQNNKIVDTFGSEGRLPRLEFLVDGPSGAWPNRLEGWLTDADGWRMDLAVWPAGPSTYSLQKVGYARTLREPRLVLRHDGKVVLEQPIPALLPPIRAIPLVVPIDRSLRLLPLKESVARRPAPFPSLPFSLLGTLPKATRPSFVSVVRTEWSHGQGFSAGRRVPEGAPVLFAPRSTDVGGFVEIDLPALRSERYVKDVSVDIEMLQDGDGVKARVLRPAQVEFPDGRSFLIPIQERRIGLSAKGEVRPHLTLNLQETPGHGPMFAAALPDSSGMGGPGGGPGIGAMPGGSPSWFPYRGGGRPGRMPPPFLKTRSSTWEATGLRKLTLGAHNLQAPASPKDRESPIVYGKHRLELRATHIVTSRIGRRRVIAVGP
ncbi:MAG: hypothetical protein ACO1SV_02170 [Fimbriimonas sp.]